MTTTTEENPMPMVTDLRSAADFLAWCDRTIGQGYHPDDPGAEYVRDGEPIFNASEAIFFDQQMESVFRLVIHPDPYDVALAFGELGRKGHERRRGRFCGQCETYGCTWLDADGMPRTLDVARA